MSFVNFKLYKNRITQCYVDGMIVLDDTENLGIPSVISVL